MSGKGAFLNGKRIKVRNESNLEKSTIGLELGHTDRVAKLDKFWRPIVDKVRYVYLYGASVSMLCYVARGWVDAYIQQANIWDLAAGVVLITEAGGKVTDFFGKESDFSQDKPRLICSNGKIHEDILKIYN